MGVLRLNVLTLTLTTTTISKALSRGSSVDFCVIFYKKFGVKGVNLTLEIKISRERPLADSQQQY